MRATGVDNRDGDVDADSDPQTVDDYSTFQADYLGVWGGVHSMSNPIMDCIVDSLDFAYLSFHIQPAEIPLRVSAVGNPYFFTGRRLHFLEKLDGNPGTGPTFNRTFQYNRARHYSPEHGRWLQGDPAEYVDGTNLFQYLNSNPVNATDSLGLGDNEKLGVMWGLSREFENHRPYLYYKYGVTGLSQLHTTLVRDVFSYPSSHFVLDPSIGADAQWDWRKQVMTIRVPWPRWLSAVHESIHLRNSKYGWWQGDSWSMFDMDESTARGVELMVDALRVLRHMERRIPQEGIGITRRECKLMKKDWRLFWRNVDRIDGSMWLAGGFSGLIQPMHIRDIRQKHHLFFSCAHIAAAYNRRLQDHAKSRIRQGGCCELKCTQKALGFDLLPVFE